jgi:hypothetical protein
MARRLLAFAVVFVVIGSPVVTTVCHAACAIREMDATAGSAGTEHHSCHEQLSDSAPIVNGAAHPCGHAADVPIGTDVSRQVVAAPAIAVVAVSFIPPEAGTLNSRSTGVEHSPPSLVALSAHLRI